MMSRAVNTRDNWRALFMFDSFLTMKKNGMNIKEPVIVVKYSAVWINGNCKYRCKTAIIVGTRGGSWLLPRAL